MDGEIVRREEVVLGRRAQLTAAALKDEVEQRALLGQYVKRCMVEGSDFGTIPGTPKPTLLKPGAEKLIALFHCEPRFELVKEFCREDFPAGFFKYTFRCVVVAPGGAVLAEGFGSANSREQRYRWRNANRRCPACGKESIIQGKAEYGGGWVCFKKKGGCGEKFTADDRRVTEQPQGRVENEDIADLDNTILKMAKKRALVDGAIALARCSDMFTQDVEDFGPGHGSPAHEPEPPQQQAQSAAPEAAPQKKGKPARRRPLEEAAKVDRTKELVGLGKHKSKVIGSRAELPDDELGEALDEAEEFLKNDPTNWAANAVMNKRDLLALEFEAREAKARTAMTDEAKERLRAERGYSGAEV